MTSSPDNIVPFTVADVPALFGTVGPFAGDPDFMEAFTNTFLQRPGGPPPPELGPPVAVTLLLDIPIVCFDGIPAKGELPTNLRNIPFSKRIKFPVGALVQLKQNRSFATKFPAYVYEGSKHEAVAQGPKKCNCCGAYADGFVTAMTVELPTENIMENLFSDACVKIWVNPAYPACQKTKCNQRLRKYMTTANEHRHTANDVAMCANDACRKVEETTGLFQKCSRCKIRCYCSKECQVKDWPEHKKMCVKKK